MYLISYFRSGTEQTNTDVLVKSQHDTFSTSMVVVVCDMVSLNDFSGQGPSGSSIAFTSRLLQWVKVAVYCSGLRLQSIGVG